MWIENYPSLKGSFRILRNSAVLAGSGSHGKLLIKNEFSLVIYFKELRGRDGWGAGIYR